MTQLATILFEQWTWNAQRQVEHDTACNNFIWAINLKCPKRQVEHDTACDDFIWAMNLECPKAGRAWHSLWRFHLSNNFKVLRQLAQIQWPSTGRANTVHSCNDFETLYVDRRQSLQREVGGCRPKTGSVWFPTTCISATTLYHRYTEMHTHTLTQTHTHT